MKAGVRRGSGPLATALLAGLLPTSPASPSSLRTASQVWSPAALCRLNPNQAHNGFRASFRFLLLCLHYLVCHSVACRVLRPPVKVL